MCPSMSHSTRNEQRSEGENNLTRQWDCPSEQESFAKQMDLSTPPVRVKEKREMEGMEGRGTMESVGYRER